MQVEKWQMFHTIGKEIEVVRGFSFEPSRKVENYRKLERKNRKTKNYF